MRRRYVFRRDTSRARNSRRHCVLGRLGMLSAVDDFLAIVRPEGAAVITHLVGELLHVGAVGIHGVDVQVAVAGGREHDVLAVPGDRGLGVVAVRAAKLFQITPIYLGRKNLIGIVDRPDVAVGIIGLRRTVRACGMSRGKQNAIAGGKEVGASSAALASAHELGYGGVSLGWVYWNRVNLIARNAFALVLGASRRRLSGQTIKPTHALFLSLTGHSLSLPISAAQA